MSSDQNTAEAQEVIVIQEEKDGSATVDLPQSIPSPDVNRDEDSDEADEAARQEEMASGGGVDPEAEAMREAKRQKRLKRKEYHKQVASEKDLKLDRLVKQNQELTEQVAILMKKSHGSDVARMNKALEDAHARISFAKQKMQEATATGNGELLTSAQEMWFDARRQAEMLEANRKRFTAPPQQQAIKAPDPMLKRYASNWMENNPWYDANGKDPDSRVALTIDQAMAEEGWNPSSSDYWEELDNRLHKYLPHRYTNNTDEKPIRNSRPRNVVTSSGRESVSTTRGGNTFTLSPEQVRAMKDAGMWDDGEKRAKMIATYAQYARQQRNG
jgi:hypothetical protein